MASTDHDRVLDFAPIGMWREITKSTADTGGELFEAINVLAPGFAGPPLHIHPRAEESYEVLSGTLEVCVGRQWRQVAPGESVTVPAGTPHTLKNGSGAEVRQEIVSMKPPQRFMRGMAFLGSLLGYKLPA